MKTWAYALVAAAAALWGIISIFVKGMAVYGFSTQQIVAVRVVISAVILVSYMAVNDRSLLKIRPADITYFIGTGICSLAFFNWCYFTAIQETTAAVAAVLLYTAPIFVVLLSAVCFGEKLTGSKLAALTAAFSGCALVVGIMPGAEENVSPSGLLYGLGAGLGYALYSIFAKFAMRRYQTMTITVYTFVVAALVMAPVSRVWEAAPLLRDWRVIAVSMGFSLFSTILPYLCYTAALSRIEPGRAALIATLEPIVATLVGVTLFGEILSGWQMFGILLVVAAVASLRR